MMQHSELRARTKRYRMVIGMDLTEYSEIVLEHALDQAARHTAPDLHFLFVRERAHRKRSFEELQQRLATIVYPGLQTFNQHATNWRARLHVRDGKAHQQIAALAQDVLADLIVIGQFGLHHPRDAQQLPSAVLRDATCPTLIVGMPRAVQESPICGECAAVRETSDGEYWFCDAHVATDRSEQVMSPATVWTAGRLAS